MDRPYESKDNPAAKVSAYAPLPLLPRRRAVQTEHRRLPVRQLRHQLREQRQPALLGDQHRGGAAPQQEGQPLPRVGGVERHIGATGREHGERRHHPGGSTVEAEGHPHLRTDAQDAQPARPMGGLAGELAVGEGGGRAGYYSG